MNLIRTITGVSLLLLVSLGTGARATGEGEEVVFERLSKLVPEVRLEDITSSKIPGVYEVVIGHQIAYVSADGRYFIQGDMIDLETRGSVTEPRLNGLKAKAVATIGEESMVIFGPKDAKHTVTVFTDIDCGYCRKLHNEIADYNKEDIRIRYLFYPRTGIGSESYDKAVSVWCADDRQQAMTDSKSGKNLPEKKCENPVDEHYALGREMGLRGTPALLLESGKMIPGYVPAKRLSSILDDSVK